MSTQDDSLMPGRRQNWACSTVYGLTRWREVASAGRKAGSKADKEWSAGSG